MSKLFVHYVIPTLNLLSLVYQTLHFNHLKGHIILFVRLHVMAVIHLL